MAEEEKMTSQEWRSGPDPTTLTTAALQREVTALRELFETRLDAIDKATSLFESNLTRVPTDVDKQIGHLKMLTEKSFDVIAVRFESIDKQFIERDVRVQGTAEQTKVAVDAALQAAEKAVGKQNDASSQAIAKSETMMMKQLDQLSVLITTTAKAADDKIVDLKDRVTRMESEDRGGRVVMTDSKSGMHMTIAIGAVVLSFIAIVVTIVLFSLSTHAPIHP